MGDLGIAHTRYKTYGSGGTVNAQPFFDPFAGIALAHNGHITNVEQIAAELESRGSGAWRITATPNRCSRVLGSVVRALPAARTRQRASPKLMFRAIAEVQQRVTGAFSVVAVTPSGLYAFRDQHGFRPMVLGTAERAEIGHDRVGDARPGAERL